MHCSDSTRVLFLHAYSPRNSGDGLLVELSAGLMREAFGKITWRAVALDAAAFSDSRFVQWGGLPPAMASRLPRSVDVMATLFGGPRRNVKRLAREADVIVAVGGGYQRARSLVELIKYLGAHYGQLALASRYGSKTIYLPQSIGPFPKLVETFVAAKLSRMSLIALRDDRSLSRFAHLSNAVRIADLAVLEIAGTFTRKSSDAQGDAIALVARNLPRPRSYRSLLDALYARFNPIVAIQSRGAGNDDVDLSRRLAGDEPTPALHDLLQRDAVALVISARLHGALQSILNGFPAVHLSYESKGWGAFEDLGLHQYVFNARNSLLSEVAAAVEHARDEPSDYWDRVAGAVPAILASRSTLLTRLRAMTRTPGPHPDAA